MDGVTAGGLSAQTQATGSTYTFDLAFNSLRLSHDGYYTCTAHLATVSLTRSARKQVLVTGDLRMYSNFQT